MCGRSAFWHRGKLSGFQWAILSMSLFSSEEITDTRTLWGRQTRVSPFLLIFFWRTQSLSGQSAWVMEAYPSLISKTFSWDFPWLSVIILYDVFSLRGRVLVAVPFMAISTAAPGF